MTKRLCLLFLLACTMTMQAQQQWRAALTHRMDSLMNDELLEQAQMGMMVWDLTDDTLLYQQKPCYLMRTASTMKVLTAITALDCLGDDYRLHTSLYYRGEVADSVLTGDLYCVGGMDPLFGEDDMRTMAESVRGLGVRTLRVRIVCDGSMKDDKMWGKGWCWDDKNPTLTPLLAGAKDAFAEQLVKSLMMTGLNIEDVSVATGQLPDEALLLCTCTHSIDDLLATMMKDSDNLFAECLYYQIAASTGKRRATAADAQAIEAALLRKIGLDGKHYRLADGSGLSLYNYLTPKSEVLLLRYAWQQPAVYKHLLPSLPIAGIDGTLEKRMRKTAAQGNVRAKTGTVTGVSTLTGYLTASNGHRLCFSIMLQGLNSSADGRRLQDTICIALCE